MCLGRSGSVLQSLISSGFLALRRTLTRGTPAWSVRVRRRTARAASALQGGLTVPLRLRRYAVRGESMAPGLSDGDFVIVLRRGPLDSLRPGQVVILSDPRNPSRTLVKRIAAVDEELGDLAPWGQPRPQH